MMNLFSKQSGNTEDEFRRARRLMVERQLAGRDVTNPEVLEVMRRVPRHLFVPADLQLDAYEDCPLPIGYGQTISQPYIVGSMTEMLRPHKGMPVLEIGTGSGYQTAVLAELCGQVVTVEIVAELSTQAQRVLKELGYANITFHIGDGLMLPESDETFDGIIVTAAPETVPPELIERLKPGGRLVMPVGKVNQDLLLITREIGGKVTTQSLYPVRFVPMQRNR